MTAEERIAVAYITRTKGIRGHVKAQVLTHRLSRFDELSAVVVQKQGQPDCALTLESWRPEPRGVLLKFGGIDTPEEARQQVVKGYVTIAAAELAPLPESTFYIFELVGCAVEDEKGRPLGEIVDVLQLPSTDVYQVQDQQNELLIPAVGDFIVDISIAERRVKVRGIDDLLDSGKTNSPSS